MSGHPTLTVPLPEWVEPLADWERSRSDDADRMALAVALAGENVRRRTGGPFGAAIFEAASGRLVSVGVNLVEGQHNAILHAEVVALMYAQARVARWTLRAADLPAHELFTSCEPCAMCLGAVHWSGINRLVIAADREDASRIGFDEGPVFEESYGYLEARGVSIVRHVLRDEAVGVLEAYRRGGGTIYNG